MKTTNKSLQLYTQVTDDSNYDEYCRDNKELIRETFKYNEWSNVTSIEEVALITFNKALNYSVLHNRVEEVMQLLNTDKENSEEYIKDKRNEVIREATLFEFKYPEELRELQFFISMHYKRVESKGRTYYTMAAPPKLEELATELYGWIPDIKKEHLLYTNGFIRFINRDYRAMSKSALHSYMSIVRGYNRFKRVVAAAYLQYIVGKRKALTVCGLDKNTKLSLESLIVTIYKRNQAQTVEPSVALGVMYSEKSKEYIDKYNSRLHGGFQAEIREYFYTVGLRYFSSYYRNEDIEDIIKSKLSKDTIVIGRSAKPDYAKISIKKIRESLKGKTRNEIYGVYEI